MGKYPHCQIRCYYLQSKWSSNVNICFEVTKPFVWFQTNNSSSFSPVYSTVLFVLLFCSHTSCVKIFISFNWVTSVPPSDASRAFLQLLRLRRVVCSQLMSSLTFYCRTKNNNLQIRNDCFNVFLAHKLWVNYIQFTTSGSNHRSWSGDNHCN